MNQCPFLRSKILLLLFFFSCDVHIIFRLVHPTYSSSSSSASSEVNPSITYGVDWSERARPTAHCWFPYKSTDPSSSQPCAYVSCKDPKSTQLVEFIHCESCSLIVHTHHLTDLQQTTTTNPI